MIIDADEVSIFFEKTLQICVEWLGLQTAATLILRILYLQHGTFISTKEISAKTGLSLTSVSLTCTQLEALGVLRRETEYHKRKGRPRKLISIEGITFNPLTNMFRSSRDVDVNYMVHYKRPE